MSLKLDENTTLEDEIDYISGIEYRFTLLFHKVACYYCEEVDLEAKEQYGLQLEVDRSKIHPLNIDKSIYDYFAFSYSKHRGLTKKIHLHVDCAKKLKSRLKLHGSI